MIHLFVNFAMLKCGASGRCPTKHRTIVASMKIELNGNIFSLFQMKPDESIEAGTNYSHELNAYHKSTMTQS